MVVVPLVMTLAIAGVFGVPVAFALPVTLTALILAVVLIMFLRALRGTTPENRAEVIKAFATLVRALGNAVGAVLRAISKIL